MFPWTIPDLNPCLPSFLCMWGREQGSGSQKSAKTTNKRYNVYRKGSSRVGEVCIVRLQYVLHTCTCFVGKERIGEWFGGFGVDWEVGESGISKKD